MKITAAVCLLVGTLTTLGNSELIEQFSDEHDKLGIFDIELEQVNEDGRHEHVTSVFEQRRQQKEALAKGDKDHPLLRQDSESADSGNADIQREPATTADYVDAFLDLIWDWNHIINVRLHRATKASRLIPTTGMSDMLLMHHECDKCWSMHGAKWVPDG
jgi:hypothetical protein